ncbi:MAG: hypothetical protein GEU81_05075 [Nitriliruptorales bacterium]|nr:hypothetical protein [Nitriliruptorales bacterium]
MQTWEDRQGFLLDEARRDLEASQQVRPCLLAMAGARRLFIAFLRPFDRGRHLDALVELLALAAPLDADRLALSIPARAWSMNDPLPPVLPGLGDLRQRVLTILEADGSNGSETARSTLIPFDLDDNRVHWGDPHVTEGETGPVSSALLLTVRHRHELRAEDRDIRTQAARCVRLGHLVAFAEPLSQRLVP